MSELMAQYEQIAKVEKELDVQAGLIEKLTDLVAWLETRVVALEGMRAARKSSNKPKGPPTPSLPSEGE